MSRLLSALFLAQAMAVAAAAAEPTASVLTYHDNLARTGNFVVPALTGERARALHPDDGFRPGIRGHVYAQPLYWREGAAGGLLLVATEDDTVYALDAVTGRTVWRTPLGRPVPLASLPCGNIDPLGITGTPVIDPKGRSVYLDAMVQDTQSNKPEHEIFALSLDDGAIRPGWPVNVAARLAAQGLAFEARNQNQRGALIILGDTLYVPYGGHFGDCADYHGWVVGVKLSQPQSVISWHTRARAGGVWAPAGISSDGRSLFVATGNTMDATRWADGEAVIRLDPALTFSNTPKDFFAPSDWRELDDRDLDLGGVAPVLFSLGGKDLAVALGKDGKAYVVDRRNLGGLGGSLTAKRVSSAPIRTAAAEYPVGDGAMIAFHGEGIGCPAGQRSDPALVVLRIGPGMPPPLAIAWCGALRGAGAPMVTTTDGRAEPIVWMLGAEGDNRLYGFRGDTGERLCVSAPLPGLRHFQSLIATRDRLFVAADDTVFAFAF
jgi:outer membrane protein assembly factor BamB